MTPHPLGIDPDEFPIRGNLTYLNHAGTSPLPRCAADALKQFADEVSGHASAVYTHWSRRLRAARAEIARLLHCDETEVAFGKSTTAGLNLVALGIAWQPGEVIVVEERTFPSNWIPWRDLAARRGAKLWTWPERDDYTYRLEDLEARLRQGGVRMVAATSANFATGFRQDMESLGRLCHEHGALLCVDAIQTLGVFPLDVKACHVDFLSADSHKWLLGPESAGLFYCAKDKLDLIDDGLVGWMGRENFFHYDALDLPPDPTARRFEEGAPNVAGNLAMGESIRFLNDLGIDRVMEHNLGLCGVLREGLEEAGFAVATPRNACASIIAAHKPGLDMSELNARLWREETVWAAARRGFLRLSPHVYQTADDMAGVVKAVERQAACI